jgi:predicted nucleotide-binding protein (sugar kinase/HSP70/actin superfamily)
MNEKGTANRVAGANDSLSSDRLNTSVSQFNVSGRTMLMPNMAPLGVRLLAASFRAVGVDAVVMDTYEGLHLGKEFTSGKECFPCQVTLGDILHYLKKEKKRLGDSFSPDRYVYFLPEADGPCRFGMYNKLQRLILDRFEEFKDIPIVYVCTRNAYATESIMSPELSPVFRRLSYVAVNIADVMDRVMWRVRPYEYRAGMTDEFMEKAMQALASTIEKVGASLDFNRIYRLVEDIVDTASSFIDFHQPRRPRIGIVGEIYLRSHPESNQNVIRQIERFGGEVVNASLAEWINFITSEQSRKLKRTWKRAWREGDHGTLRDASRRLLGNEIEKLYQSWRQGQVYRAARQHLDIQPDHTIRTIERRLDGNRIFNFEIGTEAALSIGGAIEYALHGFDGVVNVYPFTCMPSTICSAVLKPLLHSRKIPYLDTPYDGTIQPNREVALRTFMYQANQHLESRLAGRNGKAQK